MDKKALRSQGHGLKPAIQVGKDGITENTIIQIQRHLKANKLTKVKLLPTFLDGRDKKDVARQLAERTKSELVQLVGFTALLYKR